MNNTNLKNWCLALSLAAAPAIAMAAPAESEAPVSAAPEVGDCTGVIFDSLGDPLPGATVRVEGTSLAAATNIEGEFSLKGVKTGAKLTISYIGCKPKTVVWNGEPLNVTLEEDSNVLDEVVVLGYGVEQKRANVTNSIAKVSEKALTVGTNANPAQALVGAVSGVKVSITSGDPGATPSITVRGGSNFNGGSNEPLIVVDGNIRPSLADINPNDIEDMQILKDAGATAIYGARAGNGVVLITTKKGKAGTGMVTLNMKLGVNSYKDQGYDLCSSEDFLYYYRTGMWNSQWALPMGGYSGQNSALFTGGGGGQVGQTTYSPTANFNLYHRTEANKNVMDQLVSKFGWQESLDPLRRWSGNSYEDYTLVYKPNDILSQNLNSPAITQDYNLSFSGGNDRGRYYASIGYYDADGALKETYYKRYNFSMTGEYKLTNWLTSNSIFNFVRANWLTNDPLLNSANAMMRGRFWYFMNMQAYEIDEENPANSKLGAPIYGFNGPVNVNVNKGNFERDNQSDKFQMTQSLTAKIIDGLTLKGTMSWLYTESTADSSNKNYATNNAGSYNLYYGTGTGGINTQHSVSNSFSRYFDQTYNLVANFDRTFKEKHAVNVMLGTELYQRKYTGFSASGSGVPLEGYPDLALTDQDTRSVDSWHQKEALVSFFGRAQYIYDNRYIVAATFREDGYSRLVNNRWGFFPGVSLGWNLSNEKFWKENETLSSIINYAKVRGSFGMNATINSSYLGYYTLRGSYAAYRYDGTIGYRMGNLPNPNLKWERTRTGEIGFDLGFLQNRFNFAFTYYNRLTMDKYADKILPQTTGFSSVTDNNGSYQNQGIELELNTTLLRTRDFQWTLGANLTYNANKIVKLPDNGNENNRIGGTEVYTGDGDNTKFIGGYQEGQNPYQEAGFLVKTMIRNQADLDALGDYVDGATSYGQWVYATEAGRQRLIAMGVRNNQMIRLTPGNYAFKDINGDNLIDSKDKGYIGHRDPHWTGGFNTTLTWKGLSLYARFDMGFGFQVYEPNLSFLLAEGQGNMGFPTQVTDTWTPDNPGGKYPRVTWADQYGADSYVRTSDAWVQNGNYLACRELSLSYKLPDNICKKFASQGLTLSVTGQNLGYIKSCTLPLPDNVPYWYGGNAGNGGVYNLPRTVIFGLNVSF